MTTPTTLPGANISWWSLRFADRRVEADYQAYRVRHYLREIKRWGIGAIVGNLILGFFEWQLLADHVGIALGLRFGVVLPALIAIMAIFVYPARARALVDLGFVSGVLVYGAVSLVLLRYVSESETLLYLFSILFASIFLFGHMGIRFIHASNVSWILVAAFILTNRLAHPGAEAATLLVGDLLLISTNTLILLAGYNHEILARREYRRAILQNQESQRLAEAQRLAEIGSWVWDAANDHNQCSDECRRIMGFGADQPATRETFLSAIHPDDRAVVTAAFDKAMLGEAAVDLEHRVVLGDGEVRIVHCRADIDSSGSREDPIHVSGTVQDVTERRRLEEQLQRAQRLEAIGSLTGGIAHEFNNLLLVIHANLELIEHGVGNSASFNKFLSAAKRGSDRGAQLTQRLLAFSRRQMLQPQLCNLNDIVGDLEQMFSTLGEGIETTTVLNDDPWPVRIDAAQMENALLNLVINARDAMPGGGHITIETANVTLDSTAAAHLDTELVPGDYVTVAVSDTGTGMAAEVAAQAFEPFFTTKPVGEGTGLGLSMVHGFAKQSGGHLAIESAPGQGTTLRIHVPRAAIDSSA